MFTLGFNENDLNGSLQNASTTFALEAERLEAEARDTIDRRNAEQAIMRMIEPDPRVPHQNLGPPDANATAKQQHLRVYDEKAARLNAAAARHRRRAQAAERGELIVWADDPAQVDGAWYGQNQAFLAACSRAGRLRYVDPEAELQAETQAANAQLRKENAQAIHAFISGGS